MSTLRVSNIEAKADASSPSVNEKVKVTNSSGGVLIHVNGETTGIATVGVNTTGKTFDVDTNQNVSFTNSIGIGTDIVSTRLDVEGPNVPFAINSSNSNTYKIQLENAGSTVAYIGAASNEVYFANASAAEQARFTDSGLKLPSGKGIDFSATSDASGMGSELLDDYEEGVWTPDLRGGTAGTGSFTPNNAGNGGIYRKVGGIVYIQGNLRGTWTNGTASGNVEIIGLPIANRGTVSGENNANYGPVNISYYTGLTPSSSGYYVQGGLVILGSTIMHLYANNGNGGGQANMAITDVSTANDGVNWHFSATYASA